jgi:hypothetical protein
VSHSLHLAATASPWTAPSSSSSVGKFVNAGHSSKSSVQGLATSAPSTNDLALNNSTAMFSAGSLAGFHNITIDIGGKQQQLSIDSKLTAAELVAAQQVLIGSKQEIVINAKGIGTGGYFDLDSSTVAALGSAVGGSIGALDISHGVTVIDSLSSLNLVGSLVNQGTIDLGAASGAKGQTLDSITAANISNGAGAVIASAPASSGLSITSIALDTTGTFSNSGKISGVSDVNISAPTINNSGLISSTTGNVNLTGGGGNLTVNGTGGTVQAAHGDINFNNAGYAGSGNVTVSGGNWLSQQFNVNDGGGANNVSVDQLTGQVNVTAGSSHVTAETSDLNLGTSNIAGDPTYFNTAGNITLTGTLATGEDLSIVASGNVIGNGAIITTGGNALNIIAGANITNTAPTSTSFLPPPAGGTAAAVTVSNNASVTGKGSTTGGYIDLSGVTLTGTTTNTASSVSTSGGGVLMVAYKGTGANSGSIVATATAKQSTSGPTATLNAGGGTVTMIAGGSQITAQNISAGGVTILANTPVISGAGSLTAGINGTISGSYSNTITPGTYTATAVNLTSINAGTTGAVVIGTAVPILLTADSLAFIGKTASASLFVKSLDVGALTLNASSLSTGATLSVNAVGGLAIAGSLSAGTLSTTTGFITGGTISLTSVGDLTVGTGDIISGTTVNLTTTGTGGIGNITTTGTGLISSTAAILTTNTGAVNVNTAVNTLTVKGSAPSVTISESASVGKALSLLASSEGTGGTFTLNSSQPVTVSGALTATDGAVSLTESENTLNTTNGTTTVAGLTVAAAINVGSGGSVSLATTGNENIVERTVTLTSPLITINAAAAVGTAGSAFATNTTTLEVNGNSISPVYLKDIGTSAFTVSGKSTGNELVNINSKAATFTVGDTALGLGLSYTTVTLVDSATGANTIINSGKNFVGDGTGTVTITTAGPLTQVAGTKGGIDGIIVVLSSTAGSIGTSDNALLNVTSPILTANAVKGSVFVDGLVPMTLNAGTALSLYDVHMASGQTLNIGGIIKTTTALTGAISLVADSITQSLTTAYLGSANVSLSNFSTSTGGTIGLGTGFQSIQTKAINSLSVTDKGTDATPFIAFVTQTGAITLSSGSTMSGGGDSSLNLALATGNKLTVANSINFTDVAITAPASLTVSAGGNISATNLTVTSPSVILGTVSGAISLASAGTLSFISAAGLAITGAPFTIVLPNGSDVSVSGQTSITLGAATGGLNNPLSTIGGTGGSAGPLSDLTIFTKGIFTGAYDQFILGAFGPNDSLSITASSLKNSDGSSIGPFLLEANGSNSNSVNLALTGTQAVTIDSAPLSRAGAQPNFDITIAGTAGGSVSVSAAGILTVNSGGLHTPATGNAIALTGRTLVTTGLPSGEFSGPTYDSVTLGSTSGTFTVGAITNAQALNGIAGTVDAAVVTISAPTGVTINTGNIVTGNEITFNTSKFTLAGTSEIAGSGTTPSLSINNFFTGGLTIVGTVAVPGGTYSGISSVLLQSASGGINLGQLFTSLNSLGAGSGVGSIAISAVGAVTLPTTLSTLSVTSGGVIYLNASTLSYSPSTKNPQAFLTLAAPSGSVTLQLTSAITLGQVRGDYDINVGVGAGSGSYAVSSGGILTVSEVQNTTSASLTGSSIILNDAVTTSGTMLLSASGGSASSIITGGNNVVTAGTLIIGQSNSTLPAVTSALNISTPDLVVVSGALRLNNSFGGAVSVSQENNLPTLNALTLTNSSGVPGTLLTVNSLLTADGGINIVNSNGNILVSAGSNLQTTSGSITLQNNDLKGTIEIGQGVQIYGSGTGAGVGQVSIVIGPVPTTTMSAGVQPGPNLPVTSAKGSGHIFYTTTSNPSNTITSNGLNILQALGRNIVFNGNGSNSAITLDGGDSITADPPVVSGAIAGFAASGAANLANSFAPTIAVPASSAVSIQNPLIGNNAASQIPTLNWSLPTTVAINSFQSEGIAAAAANNSGVTAVVNNSSITNEPSNSGVAAGANVSTGSAAANASGVASGVTCSVASGGSMPLSGGVSNCTFETFEHGAKLLAPKISRVLNTGFGSVKVAAGSVVMVMAFDGGMAVYNLHDTKSGAVEVRVGGRTVKLTPGQNVVLTDKQIRCFEEINPAQFVAYRRMAAKQWDQGVQAFQAEFSIVSMLQSVAPLREMVRAKDAETRKAVDSVLKTSAILKQFGGAQYEYMVPAAVTAMGAR